MSPILLQFHNGYQIIREEIIITINYYKYLDLIFCANDADNFSALLP